MKRVAVIGSTGSIGRQTLDVIAEQPGLCACGLAARCSWELLAEQARQHRPKWVAIADDSNAEHLRNELPPHTQMLAGEDALTELVIRCQPDVLLSAVVGTAGLAPTMEGISQGASLAIANKETLVMAGQIVMPAAREAGVPLLPVDSEHSAIFQCLQAGKADEVRKVSITASGGALRDWSDDEAHEATVQDALNHPTWDMGRKITIDSATMVNKALEVIEAHWLFDLTPEQIDVLIHPESIIHSLVEFRDGNVIAQLARPDMKLPIAYALAWPDRPDRSPQPLDLPQLASLTFRAPAGRFQRAIDLAYEVIRRGGVTGAAFNAANEVAVEAFLAGRISFGKILRVVEDILNRCPSGREVSLTALAETDAWARDQAAEMLGLDPSELANGRLREV